MKKFAIGFPWHTFDPFLFCAHHQDIYPPGNERLGIDKEHLGQRALGSDFEKKDGFRMYHGKQVPGFPYHPHCGFETITLVTEGYIDHSDSLGAAARFGEGDVQWMTAGSGVQHSEMFPLLNADKENRLELFQIWLNLPAKSKQVEAHFDMIWSESIPSWTQDGVFTRLIFGQLDGQTQSVCPPNSWAAEAENQLQLVQYIIDPGATLNLTPHQGEVNRALYLYKGNATLNQVLVEEGQGVYIEADEHLSLENTSDKPAFLLLMQGRPIEEPVAKYGPFVMNTSEEIEAAISKYRRTEFGGWPWPEAEHVHGADRGRFAQYPDGYIKLPNQIN
ncbi:MAG: pirin family protein [Flavobacteriaceae bacterium]